MVWCEFQTWNKIEFDYSTKKHNFKFKTQKNALLNENNKPITLNKRTREYLDELLLDDNIDCLAAFTNWLSFIS